MSSIKKYGFAWVTLGFLVIFEAGTLNMAFNPSDLPADLACTITANPIFTGDFSQYGEGLRLGPWSAVVG